MAIGVCGSMFYIKVLELKLHVRWIQRSYSSNALCYRFRMDNRYVLSFIFAVIHKYILLKSTPPSFQDPLIARFFDHSILVQPAQLEPLFMQ